MILVIGRSTEKVKQKMKLDVSERKFKLVRESFRLAKPKTGFFFVVAFLFVHENSPKEKRKKSSTHSYCDRRRRFCESAEKENGKEEDFQLFCCVASPNSHLEIGSTAEVLSILVENLFDDVEMVDDDAPSGAECEAVNVAVDLADRAESFEGHFVLTEQCEIAENRPGKGTGRLRQNISFRHFQRHFHASLALVDQLEVDDEQEDQDDVEQVEANESHFTKTLFIFTHTPIKKKILFRSSSTSHFPTYPIPT